MDKNIIPTEVVAALIWEGSRFLICQRPRHKARGSLWEFVGGKVEPGESKEEALIRECREELSITVQPGEVFMEVTHHLPRPDGAPHPLERLHPLGCPAASGAPGHALDHARRDRPVYLLPRRRGHFGKTQIVIKLPYAAKPPQRIGFSLRGFFHSGRESSITKR